MNEPLKDKTAIRREMRSRRKALSPEAKARASAAICGKLVESDDLSVVCDPFESDGALAVYLASPDEIDLTAVIKYTLELGGTVVAPRWNGETYELAKLKSLNAEDLREGPMGILEPKEAEIVQPRAVAVWLVPGLAFTRDGKRLGYGGGWYDRLMAESEKHSKKIGVAHSFQVVDDLPSEPHDIRLDGVVDDSLDHPQIEFTELPDGFRAKVSIEHRGRWWLSFFLGLLGMGICPWLLWGGVKLVEGGARWGIGVVALGGLAALVAAVALLYALGGPWEAELEAHGDRCQCRRKWLGLVPHPTRHFAWNPWTRFVGCGYGIFSAPKLAMLQVREGRVYRSLFRASSAIASLLAIRMNLSRTEDPETLRAAREKLLTRLPRGMTIRREGTLETMSVYAPTLRLAGMYLAVGLVVLLLATLILLLLARWPMLMLSAMGLVGALYLAGLVYMLLKGLFGKYQLTLNGEAGEYVSKLGPWKRMWTFPTRSLRVNAVLSTVYAKDEEGREFSFFGNLPPRYHVYVEQFARDWLERNGRRVTA